MNYIYLNCTFRVQHSPPGTIANTHERRDVFHVRYVLYGGKTLGGKPMQVNWWCWERIKKTRTCRLAMFTLNMPKTCVAGCSNDIRPSQTAMAEA